MSSSSSFIEITEVPQSDVSWTIKVPQDFEEWLNNEPRQTIEGIDICWTPCCPAIFGVTERNGLKKQEYVPSGDVWTWRRMRNENPDHVWTCPAIVKRRIVKALRILWARWLSVKASKTIDEDNQGTRIVIS